MGARDRHYGRPERYDEPDPTVNWAVLVVIALAALFIIPIVLLVGLSALTFAIVFVPAWAALYALIGWSITRRRTGRTFTDHMRDRWVAVRDARTGVKLVATVVTVTAFTAGLVTGGDPVMVALTAAALWVLIAWVAYDFLPQPALDGLDGTAAKTGEAVSKALATVRRSPRQEG